MIFSQIIKFLKQYIFKHPLYVVVYGATYFLKSFKFHAHFCSENEATKFLNEGKSLIRIGDGEINLLLNLKNHYHSFSPKLKAMMKEIIASYSSECSYMLSVPRFVNFSNKELRTMGKFNVWLPLKVMFLLLFPKKVSYMDAHNFYYDNYFENVISPLFKDRTVVFITNKKTIEKQKSNKNLPWQDAIYVEAPEINAMDAYEDIKRNLDKVLKGIDKKNVVIFGAMGPVGKYIIYEYANKGYQGIDIGKGLEVAFTGESIKHLSI